MTSSPRQLRAALAALLLALGAVLATAVPAGAATVSGPTTFTFTGSAFKKQGVKVKGVGRTSTAERDAVTRYVLPTTGAVFGKRTTTVRHAGSLELRRKSGGKTRKIKLSGIELRLKTKPVVSAKVGGKRLDLLSLDLRKNEYTATASGAVIRVDATAGTLTKKAAERIGRSLRIKKLKRGAFAVVASTASAPSAGGVGAPGGPGTPPGPGSPAVVNGGYPEPASLTRPATAVDVTSSDLVWKVRESLVCYLWNGNGIHAADGASGFPPRKVDYCGQNFTTDFRYAPAGGWYDPVSNTARLLFSGTVQLRYEQHGLGIDIKNPEVELNGVDSRLIVRFDGVKASAVKARAVFIDLNPAGANRAGSTSTNHLFGNTPGGLAAGAAYDAFSGFYDVGSEQGTFDIAFTTP